MEFELICTEDKRKVLHQLLTQKGIVLNKNSDYVIIEYGQKIPSKKISILFEYSSIDMLIDLLSNLKTTIKSNGVIVGVTKNENYKLIKLSEIIYFYANNNEIYCVTKHEKLRIKKKLYELEEELDNNLYLRINKSQIVNITYIETIIPWFNNRLLLQLKHIETELEVSKNKVKAFKSFLRM